MFDVNQAWNDLCKKDDKYSYESAYEKDIAKEMFIKGWTARNAEVLSLKETVEDYKDGWDIEVSYN